MNKTLLSLLIFTLLLASCKREQDPFQIGKQHIGLLTDSTQVKDIESLFSNDSVVKFIGGDEFVGIKNDIEVFEKGGKKLLVLTPGHALDSTAVIESVQIIDSRYKTDKNISVLSTFKDISSNYKISKIDNLINSVLVTVNELNASFAIDKKELPANLRFNMDMKFEAIHIPDDAKLKYFFLMWSKY